jgi:hypothetical protein
VTVNTSASTQLVRVAPTRAGERAVFSASIPLASPGGPWAPYLVATENLAERCGVAPVAAAPPEPLIVEPGVVGFLGEAEVLRRLAEAESLNLFRPFPDMATAEVLVRDVGSHRVAGLQVKTVGLDRLHADSSVSIARPSFRPSATTWLVVLAWLREEERFHQECLVIPSLLVEEVAHVDGEHLRFDYHPGSRGHGRLDPFRAPLADLGGWLTRTLSARQ